MRHALTSQPVYPAEAYRKDMEELEREWIDRDIADVSQEPAGGAMFFLMCVAAGILIALFFGIDTIWSGPVQDSIVERLSND